MEITNPSYCIVVEPILRENKGDAANLLLSYPNFDTEAIPDDAHERTILHRGRIIQLHSGRTYLHRACWGNHVYAVRGLMQCGANLLCNGKQGRSAMTCWGLDESKVNLAAWLFSTFADARTAINHVDRWRFSMLHSAALSGLSSMIHLLLRHGADITLKDKKGRTPLQMLSVLVRRPHTRDEAVKMLILEAAERAYAVLMIGEWRPWTHIHFPPKYRAAMCTLVVIAKAQARQQRDTVDNTDGTRCIVSRFPQACLNLLPEELLQQLFVYITLPAVPDVWTNFAR